MDKLTLIKEIDDKLASSVDATRNAHAQIQQIMLLFREQAQAEQQQQQQQKQTNLKPQ